MMKDRKKIQEMVFMVSFVVTKLEGVGACVFFFWSNRNVSELGIFSRTCTKYVSLYCIYCTTVYITVPMRLHYDNVQIELQR